MERIASINGLRGLAVITVMMYHIYHPLVNPHFGEALVSIHGVTVLHYAFYTNLQRAVDFFFILSGFVLTLPYVSGNRTMENVQDIWKFYSHRTKRLLPLYYINVVVFAIFMSIIPRNLLLLARDTFLMGTLSFHFFSSTWFPAYNGILWSIGAEFWFCALLPFILLAIKRFGLVRVLIPIAIVSIFFQWYGATTVGIRLNFVSDNVLGRLNDFCTGVLLAYAYVRGWNPLGRYGLLVGTLIALTGLGLTDWLWLGILHPADIYPIAQELLNVGLFFMLLHILRTSSRIIRFILCNRPLQLIGMMSYSIYIWHVLLIPKYEPIRGMRELEQYVFMMALLCWLSYRYIEFGYQKDWRKLLPSKALPKPLENFTSTAV